MLYLQEPFFELRARLSLPAESKPKGARPAGEEAQPEGPGAAVSRPPEARARSLSVCTELLCDKLHI